MNKILKSIVSVFLCATFVCVASTSTKALDSKKLFSVVLDIYEKYESLESPYKEKVHVIGDICHSLIDCVDLYRVQVEFGKMARIPNFKHTFRSSLNPFHNIGIDLKKNVWYDGKEVILEVSRRVISVAKDLIGKDEVKAVEPELRMVVEILSEDVNQEQKWSISKILKFLFVG